MQIESIIKPEQLEKQGKDNGGVRIYSEKLLINYQLITTIIQH